MKRDLPGLILCILLVAALCAAFAGLQGFTSPKEPQQNPPPASSKPTGIPLIQEDPLAITSLTFSGEQNYTVTSTGMGRMAVAKQEGVPFSAQEMEQLAQQCCQLYAQHRMDRGDAPLSSFGLEPAVQTVQISLVGKEDLLLHLGNETPDGGRYVRLEGKKEIYQVKADAVARLLSAPNDLAERQVTPALKEDSPLLSLSLSGESLPLPLSLEKVENEEAPKKYQMTAPVPAYLYEETLDPLFSSLSSLTADQAVCLSPTPEEVKAHGLDFPFVILDAQTAEESFSLRVSQEKDGRVFLQREGVPVIYEIPVSSLPWYGLQYEDLVQSAYVPPDLSALVRLTVSGEKDAFAFTCSRTEEGPMVTCNGEEVEEELFKKLVQTGCLSVSPLSYVLDPPKGEAVLTIQAVTASQTDTLRFWMQGGRTYLSVNGVSRYTVSSQIPSLILQNCQKVLEGQAPRPLQ